MLVGRALVAIDADSLVDPLAVEVEPFAQRFHDELLKIAAKEQEPVLVGKDDHVLGPLPVGGQMPHEGQKRGRILGRVVLAGRRVHGRGSVQQSRHVQSLKQAGNQPDGGQLAGAPADPVPHREPRQPALLLNLLVQLRPRSRHGDGMAGEVQTLALVGRGDREHAVASLRRASALAHDHHDRLVQGITDSGQLTRDAFGVGVIDEVGLHPIRARASQSVGDEHGTERRSANSDGQDSGEPRRLLRLDFSRVDLGRERLDRRQRLADLLRDLRLGGKLGARSQ